VDVATAVTVGLRTMQTTKILDVLGMNQNQEKDFYLKGSHEFKDQQMKESLGTMQNKVVSALTLEKEVDFTWSQWGQNLS